MAMSKSTIQEVRNLTNELVTLANQNSDITPASLGINSAQFEEFLNHTEGGTDFLNKYMSLIVLINKYYAQITSINTIIENFLAEQERLNG